jgi:hypothetical protein
LSGLAPYDYLIGDVGAELTPVWVAGPPSLDIPRAFIAGGRNDDIGFNSLIEDDDDGTLAIADKYATLPRNNNVAASCGRLLGRYRANYDRYREIHTA